MIKTSLAGAVLALAVATPALADPIAMACMAKTLYSDETCACIAADAQSTLSPGQYAYLIALVDDTAFNAPATRRINELSAGQALQVHGFAWTDGTRCLMDGAPL